MKFTVAERDSSGFFLLIGTFSNGITWVVSRHRSKVDAYAAKRRAERAS